MLCLSIYYDYLVFIRGLYLCNIVLKVYLMPVNYYETLYYVVKFIYRVSQEECVRLREGVPYVKVYRYNPKHLCPKLKGYGDNGQRSLKL